MKKMIRRLAAAFLSLLLLLSLAACGGKGSEQQQDNSAEPSEDSGQVETDSKLPHDHTSKGNKGESDTPPASPAPADNEQAQAALDWLRISDIGKRTIPRRSAIGCG